MEPYLLLKWVHVIASTILFGTGLGIAYFQWSTYRRGDVAAIASVTRLVVRADFLFTTPAVIVQLASGLLLRDMLSLPWSTAWVAWALVLFVLVGACWLPVVVIQMRLARLAASAAAAGNELPAQFHRAMRAWFWLGWPAFLGVLAIFWLMLAKPAG
jgi:uncharacterized membrane protein